MTEPRRERTQRAEWIWAPLLFAFVTFWLYRSIWFGQPRQLFGWDCLESYWPDLSYYAGALAHGQAPLWNPFDRGGYPFAADPQPGLYSPLTWLFVVPGALLGGMPVWTIQVKALLMLALAGTLLHAYARSRGLPAAAAALAGVAYIAAAPSILHKASILCWPMAFAPLVWIATDRALEKAREPGWWRRAAALAGAIYLAGSAGSPPGFFYTLLLAVVYGGFRLWVCHVDARRQGQRKEAWLAFARVIGVAALATAALLLVVVLPGLWMADDSATRGAARNLSYALHTAMPVGRTLAGQISPAAGAVDAYVGLAVVILSFVALVARPGGDRGVPVVLFLFAGFCYACAFGGGTPVLPWLVEHVPGFALFREPNRYKNVAALALAVVAAHGLTALMVHESRRRALVALGSVLAAILVVLLVLRSRGVVSRQNLSVGFGFSLAVFAGLATLFVAIVLAPPGFRAGLAAAAIGLAYVDTVSFAQGFVKTREALVDDQEDRRYIADLDTDGWRIYDEYVMEQRAGLRLRVRDFRGYPSGDPLDDARYAQVRERLKKNPELLAAFNVRWLLAGPHHRNGRARNHVPAAPESMKPRHFRKLDGKRWEVLGAAPLALVYAGVQEVKPPQALESLVAQEQLVGQRRLAVVETPDVPRESRAAIDRLRLGDAAPLPVAGRVTRYEANHIVVAVDAPADGLLVLNEKMAPGWRVSVDGQAATPLRANFLLRAVAVPAGAHVVEWTYAPPRYGGLFGLWLAGLAFLAAAALSAWRARRPPR